MSHPDPEQQGCHEEGFLKNPYFSRPCTYFSNPLFPTPCSPLYGTSFFVLTSKTRTFFSGRRGFPLEYCLLTANCHQPQGAKNPPEEVRSEKPEEESRHFLKFSFQGREPDSAFSPYTSISSPFSLTFQAYPTLVLFLSVYKPAAACPGPCPGPVS